MIIALCAVSVFALVSCASQPKVNYEMAKIYLTDKALTVGEFGDFFDGLDGVSVSRHPWGGSREEVYGTFYLAADTGNLYVRADIFDKSLRAWPHDFELGSVWNGTSLQVFFGTNTKKRTEYTDGDVGLQMFVVQPEEEDGDLRVQIGRFNSRQFKGAVVEWTENSYILDMSISLDALSMKKPLKANQTVMLEFRINTAKSEEEEPEMAREFIVNWRTPTDNAWKDPSTWSYGTVVKR